MKEFLLALRPPMNSGFGASPFPPSPQPQQPSAGMQELSCLCASGQFGLSSSLQVPPSSQPFAGSVPFGGAGQLPGGRSILKLAGC